MNADGSDELGLTSHPFDDGWPSWSPDGQRITWARRSGLNGHIYVIESDGTDETRITDVQLPVLTPSWSPDGLRIAFVSVGLQIYAVEIDTREVAQLTGK